MLQDSCLYTEVQGRGSILTGSSIHNQRVERMWRDVRRIVVRQYYNLFFYLEENQLLDPYNDLDLYSLHYVYIPRINRALDEYVRQHNNHPVRTESHRTPLQLFYSPYFAHSGCDQSLVNLNTYGVEEEGPVPNPDVDDVVVVAPCRVALMMHSYINSIC